MRVHPIRSVTMRVFLLALTILALGCGGENQTDLSSCAELEGRTYRSVQEAECGLTPDGIALCRWTTRFDDGEFEWAYSDVIEIGPYRCEDGQIQTEGLSGRSYEGSLQPDGSLIFEGLEYLPEA